MYLLDTNICIYIINKHPAQVLDKLYLHRSAGLFISSISVAELQYGVYHSSAVEANRMALAEFLAQFELLDFDSFAAEHYGILRQQLQGKGQLIGPYDMLIAAQALAHDLILVTNNTREFKRIKQLKLEDWKKETKV
jgi:tRNA(fMet)-specific endonuclease VapC